MANGNGHGGNRNGSGRPKGSPNRRTREARAYAEAARDAGVSPLDAMLQAMRALHSAGQLTEAAEIGRWAAPYCHPRLSSVDVAATVSAPAAPITFVEVVRPAGRNGDED